MQEMMGGLTFENVDKTKKRERESWIYITFWREIDIK